MNFMKNYISPILLLLLFLTGCNTDEENVQTDTQTNLKINCHIVSDGNHYFDNNILVNLYDSEEEYLNPIGKPLYSKNIFMPFIRDHVAEEQSFSVNFDDIKPIKYWIKISCHDFYFNYHEILQNTECYELEYPLLENTTTTIEITTKWTRLESFNIRRIEIHDIPDWINSNIGDNVELSFFTEMYSIPHSGIIETEIDSRIATINNSYIIYEPLFINTDHNRKFITLSNIGSSTKKTYDIDINHLLKSNLYIGEKYIKLNDKNEIEYIIYGTW